MAWVEFHGAKIKRLKKFSDLRRLLGWSVVEGLGFLGSFWGEVIELAEDGDISAWSAEYLCDLTAVKTPPDRVWKALVETHWIDLTDDGMVLVHDWMEYAHRYLELRYRTSNPKRLEQIKDKHKSVFSQSKDRQPTKPNPPTIPNEPKKLAQPVDKSEYSKDFVDKAEKAKGFGVNIYALLGVYRKRSKVAEPIPEAVLDKVLDSIVKYKPEGDHFPYFLMALEQESRRHFANKNVVEGDQFKKDGPASLGQIMAGAK